MDPTLQCNRFNRVTWIPFFFSVMKARLIFWPPVSFEQRPCQHRHNVLAVCNLRLNIWGYWYWCQASKTTIGQTEVTSTATGIRGQRKQMPGQFMNSSLRGNRAVSRDRSLPPTPARQDVMICVNLLPVKSFYLHALYNKQDSQTEIQSRDCGDGELRLKWRASIYPPQTVTVTHRFRCDEVMGGNWSSLEVRRKTYILCIIWLNKPFPTLIKVITWVGHS